MDVIDQNISFDEVASSREKFAKERQSGYVDKNTQFGYAFNLCRSKDKDCLYLAIKLLEDLTTKADDKSIARDYLFFTSIAFLKLKEYERASDFVDLILQREPTNHQILELKNRIQKDQKRDGIIGAAVVAGGAAATAGIIGLGIAALGIALTRKK